MTTASERATELRAKLAEAEAEAKAERQAERAKRQREEREALHTKVLAFQAENADIVVGHIGNWAGFESDYRGVVTLSTYEYDNFRGSVEVPREQLVALIAGLQKMV